MLTRSCRVLTDPSAAEHTNGSGGRKRIPGGVGWGRWCGFRGTAARSGAQPLHGDQRVGRGTRNEPFVKGPLCAEVEGFSLHAAAAPARTAVPSACEVGSGRSVTVLEPSISTRGAVRRAAPARARRCAAGALRTMPGDRTPQIQLTPAPSDCHPTPSKRAALCTDTPPRPVTRPPTQRLPSLHASSDCTRNPVVPPRGACHAVPTSPGAAAAVAIAAGSRGGRTPDRRVRNGSRRAAGPGCRAASPRSRSSRTRALARADGLAVRRGRGRRSCGCSRHRAAALRRARRARGRCRCPPTNRRRAYRAWRRSC